MSSSPAQFVAIVPAAGHSRRMGQPKLLLPLAGRPVIARLVEALSHPAVVEVLVVVRPDDHRLAAASAEAGATVVRPPEPPADMKASVGWGLRELSGRPDPPVVDGWLLCPADHPVLDAAIIDELVTAWCRLAPRVLIPTCGGRRGHPSVFAWELAGEVGGIPEDAGLNWLVAREAEGVCELALDREEVLLDLDTPADYEALCRRLDGE